MARAASSIPLSDSQQDDVRRICADCIGEPYLSAKVEKEGEEGTCSYCEDEGKCITIEELADEIEGAFEVHYRRTPVEPDGIELALAKEGQWSRAGDPVIDAIANAATVDEDIAKHVQQILDGRHEDWDMIKVGEETEFADDSYYEEIGADDVEYHEQWRGFEASLKTETRYFNKTAHATLTTVFEGVAEHVTFQGRKIVVEAGPGKQISSLYRARAFQSAAPLKKALARPDRGVGPPPYDAAKPGRMNAGGISVFYGALDPMIALAEIRPPVGSRVVVARFNLLRGVRLLDVKALESVYVKGSIFDPSLIRKLERARFLEWLSKRISMPVMPNDEASDYLATQAIADFLATELKLDGIIYPSAQADGRPENVVLFQHASRVKEIEFAPGTELSADTYRSTDEGHESDYTVWEELPAKPPESKEPRDFGVPDYLLVPDAPIPATGFREETLQVDTASVKVHHVKAVTFTTDEYPVRRHRFTKPERQAF